MTRRYRLATLFLVGTGTAMPATADDAELFLTDPAVVNAPANLLFLIDTSGSMGTLVGTQAPWDAETAFSGCYRGDALYFSATGALPDCSSPAFFEAGDNTCAASLDPLAATGFYADELLAWDGDRQVWAAPVSGGPSGPVECRRDRGVHGDGTSGVYAADGEGGPWAADTGREPAWGSRYILYSGNWLNWKINPPTVERTRLEIVQTVVGGLADTLQNVRVGVMQFNRNDGAAVVHAVEDLAGSRAQLKAVVNGLVASGGTPLSESLYEAARYLAGGPVDFGNLGEVRSVAAARDGGTTDGATYRSPVNEACGRNFVILLTDGEPSDDADAPARITDLPDFQALVGAGCDGTGEGHCLDDLAAYLQKRDLRPDLPGLQNVTVHTIGFSLDLPLLAETALRGGGQYRLASDTASLASALGGIVLSIRDNASTFAAPAVPVNAFSRTQNLGDVFLSVFRPADRARWPGNLKKYRLSNGELVGQDNRPVIDAASGAFAPDAFSFWSSVPDGDKVEGGGAASRLPEAATRVILTNLVPDPLTAGSNRLSTTNTVLLAGLTEVPESERATLVQWALGQDVRDADQDGDTGESRHDMGDSLHAQPVSLFYAGTEDDPVMTVFTATNDGYLHAIDALTGRELWAFVPARLLDGLYRLYRNEAGTTKQYGLDGTLELIVVGDDRRPGIQAPERAVLLIGMGRGGDGLFALDVTDRTVPELLWEISSADAGFGALGQTWSTPSPARVNVDHPACTPQGAGRGCMVAVFGGGYDTGQDNGGYRVDTLGNAIYMVNLLTGELLWSVGPDESHDLRLPGMQHAIPAPVRPLDLDGDGLADRLYAGDTGGRLWRFDIRQGSAPPDLVEGGLFATLGAADLGTDPPAADIRRFYVAPDVTPVLIDRQLVLTVNIGSGFRGHPLDTTVLDGFFSVRDFRVSGILNTEDYPPPVTLSDLVEITGDPSPALPAPVAGWRLMLNRGTGEKVLGPSLTLDNTVFFTSFTPGATASACLTGSGTSRLYAISVFDGRPLTNFDVQVAPDEPLDVNDRARTLITGIPVPQVTLFSSDDGPLICAGTECLTGDELPSGRSGLWRTYWFQDESL